MGITTPLPSDLQVAIGGGTTSVKMLDLVQAYSVFANQGSKVPLRAITEIDDQAGDVLYKAPALSSQQILTPAESYLMTDVLKGYQTQWQFGWKRQMAAKSGTPAGAGGIPNALIVAYNPTIVVGAWVANTSNDASKTGKITAWSTQVGQYTLNKFINGLPASYGGWFQQPQGIVVGKGCPGMPDSGKEIFLTGTDRSPGCAGSPSPSPTPSPSPSASPSPTPGPSARATPPGPSIVPSVASSPLPVPSLGLTTSPSPTPGPSPSPTPQPSVSP
jgi:membrane peptidoglycan carboxypeptidase